MSYENAPATKFIAVNCCVCGRPLVDAISVEEGIGPICRDKFGLNKASDNADFAKALNYIIQCKTSPATKFFDSVSRNDARGATNALIYTISALAGVLDCMDFNKSPDIDLMINAVESLGYSEVAEIIRERITNYVDKLSAKAKIKIKQVGDFYELIAPFSRDFLNMVHKECPGNRWIGGRNVRLIPIEHKAGLHRALVRAYPGQLFVSDRGVNRLFPDFSKKDVEVKVEPVKVESKTPEGYEEM